VKVLVTVVVEEVVVVEGVVVVVWTFILVVVVVKVVNWIVVVVVSVVVVVVDEVDLELIIVEAVAGVIRITSLMYSKGWKISLGIILGKSHWILQHPLAQQSMQL
jgi:hypothetical protein